MHAPKFFGEGRRCDAVTNLPTGHVIGLTKGRYNKAAGIEILICAKAKMLRLIEDHMFVDFIANQIDIVLGTQSRQGGDVVFVKGSNGSGAWRVAAAMIASLQTALSPEAGETHDAA